MSIQSVSILPQVPTAQISDFCLYHSGRWSNLALRAFHIPEVIGSLDWPLDRQIHFLGHFYRCHFLSVCYETVLLFLQVAFPN